eukprot:6140976-Amphidinium_carterae.3
MCIRDSCASADRVGPRQPRRHAYKTLVNLAAKVVKRHFAFLRFEYRTSVAQGARDRCCSPFCSRQSGRRSSGDLCTRQRSI